jgi:predicted Rdx family selenoprotein
MGRLDLAIRYDPARGFEDAALALARRLFAQFDEAIDSLALTPGEGEGFALYLNGTLLTSHDESGRAPLVADVRAALAGQPPDGAGHPARPPE